MSTVSTVVNIVSSITDGPEGMKSAYMSICGVDMLNPYAKEPILPEMAFQWWPTTLTDRIDVGWSFKDIPGASHALAHWGSNGGRTISFEVKLSRFMKPAGEERSIIDIAKDPLGINTPLSESPIDNRPYNVSVVGMIRYLRSYCSPRYGEMEIGYEAAFPPPVAILNVPKFGLNEDGGDSIYAVMTGCDVIYNLAFPDGTPRLATVALTFRQIVQNITDGTIRFKGRPDSYGDIIESYTSDATLDGGHRGQIEKNDPDGANQGGGISF